MNAAELLARVPLFEDLQPEALERLASVTHTDSFGPDEDIVEIGDAGHSLFVVLEGEVQVIYPARSQDFELARLGPGDFFGEMAVLNGKPRSATVRTVGDCRVLVLDKDDFRRILMEKPAVAVQLLEDLSVRLRNTDEQISGLNDKAMRDALTGLLNRRAFHDRILEECDRQRRYGDFFSLILVDVDKFKSINDNLGHDVGDEVLGWLGRLLEEHTRTADAPFRIGGEEFAILCPRTQPEIADQVANRIIREIAGTRPPLTFDMQITLSGGYASCPAHGATPDRIFQIADRALLKAKHGGRNRICTPEEVPLARGATG